jgi:hypothetical protein
MPAHVTREEFKLLQDEIEGEKLVTRHILHQTQLNSNDLATIMKQLHGVENQVQGIENRVQGIENRVQGIEKQLEGIDLKALVRKVDGLEMRFSAFVREFPATVAEIMRHSAIRVTGPQAREMGALRLFRNSPG